MSARKRRAAIRAIEAGLVLSFLTGFVSTGAVELTYSGFMRNRNHIFYNLDLDRSQTPQNRIFGDIRFRVDPTFHVAEWAEIKSSFDVLDDVYGGSPHGVMAYSNPASAQDPFFMDTSGITNRGKPLNTPEGTPALRGKTIDMVSGVNATDGNVRGTGRNYFLVRRVWAEITTPVTLIKVGRQPNHWGLGIVANDGSDINSNLGDTTDRLMFVTRMGPYLIMPGYGKKIENMIDNPDDDFSEWFLYLGRYSGTDGFFGFYVTVQTQNHDPATAGSDFADQGTDLWIMDLYGKYLTSIVNVQGEAAVFTGKITGRDTLAFNAALRVDQTVSKFLLLGEAGFSSGTSNSARKRNKLNTVLFNREYKFSKLLFAEALPINPGANVVPIGGGAVGNAIYMRGEADWNVVSWFTAKANLIGAYAVQNPLLAGTAETNARFYGIEYDLTANFKPKKQLDLGATFAHFIPGSVYNSVSKAQTALLLEFYVNLLF